MCDTIETLVTDILASAGSDGPRLVERLQTFWCKSSTEIEALREVERKVKSLLRLKDTEIRELKTQIAKLSKLMFGASSDHNPNKGKGPEVDEAASSSTPDATHSEKSENRGSSRSAEQSTKVNAATRNRSGRRKRVLPEQLERREIYMGTEDRKCPCGCGGSILSYDENEALAVDPARYYVAIRQYPRYRCRAIDKVKSTPFEPRIFSHTSMSNGLLANAVSMRFSWQLPWYRQESILRSCGVDLNRSTLMKWSSRVAVETLLPLHEMMEMELKTNSTRLFMDETTLPFLQPGNGKTRTSYLYALLRDDRSFGGNKPPVVIYHPRKTRAMHNIHDILSGVSAIVQTDAYAGYGQLGKPGTTVENATPVKCWAHTRRYFTDEYEFNKTDDARLIVGVISELYEEEAKVRGKPPLVREAHRREFSVRILERLNALLSEISDHHLKKSKMGKAVAYTQRHWDELTRFIGDGRIDLDTNAVERMFKPTILLRKNALFIGSDEGALAWGIHATIIETCKLNGVNVEPYLKWVLDQIAAKLPRSEYEKLPPWNAPTEFLIKR
jgi:transposase